MRRRPLACLALATSAALPAAACSASHETALAIEHARRVDATRVVLRTECADHLKVTITPHPGGKPEITVWGRPELGRCEPQLVIDLATDQITDGATSQAVQVEPA